MIEHHTKNKGDLGVLAAKLDLFKKGWVVCNPETEHAPFDLVIWKDGVIKTVQVKYREAAKGYLTVNFSSSWADKQGTHVVPVNLDYIDLYCVYCPDTEKCYYFDPEDFNRSATLRIDLPKNNQKLNIKMASDYLEVPV